MKKGLFVKLISLLFVSIIHFSCGNMKNADIILINGKIITVDKNFSIAEAVAISGDKIEMAGTDEEIRKYAGSETKIIDLKGKTVIPGIIDSHLHPEMASLSEMDEEIPDVNTVGELLVWIRDQVMIKTQGEWIIHPKFFFSRLIECRPPTLSELDSVAPNNPVFFDGSFGGIINSAAMKLSGITENTENAGITKDINTGKPTGFIKASAFELLMLPQKKQYTNEEEQNALRKMMHRYNRYGITSLFSGSGSYGSFNMYRDMHDKKMLTTRIYQNILLPVEGEITKEKVTEKLKTFNMTTGYGDDWVKIGSLKILLDGGILTGTSYLQQPWGAKAEKIFGITEPGYRGVINYSREDLLTIVSVANEFNWSFTVHATGGGSVDLLLSVFDEVNKGKNIRDRRFSIIHGNFFCEEAIRKMRELGIYANIQPAWFYKDADAMKYILGNERIKIFHPLKSLIDAGVMINGGSDHMVKWEANTSINPYNPFLAIWTMVTRTTERDSVINPSEAVSREEALKIYTINNAFASFEENIKGSIEPGKLADIAVLTDDILTCPVDKIKEIESVMTLVGGAIVYSSPEINR